MNMKESFWSICSDRAPCVAYMYPLAGAAQGRKRAAGNYRAAGKRAPSRKASKNAAGSHSEATRAAIEEAVAQAKAVAEQQKQAAVAAAVAQARKEAEEATAAKYAHTQCIICQDNVKEVAMLPCGHATTCEKCHVKTVKHQVTQLVTAQYQAAGYDVTQASTKALVAGVVAYKIADEGYTLKCMVCRKAVTEVKRVYM